MELQTILQILYANNLESVVSLAVKIDAEIKEPIVTKIRADLTNEDIKASGMKFKNRGYANYYECKVVGYNQYRLEHQWLIELPNGKTKWVNNNQTAELAELELLEPVLLEVPQSRGTING